MHDQACASASNNTSSRRGLSWVALLQGVGHAWSAQHLGTLAVSKSGTSQELSSTIAESDNLVHELQCTATTSGAFLPFCKTGLLWAFVQM